MTEYWLAEGIVIEMDRDGSCYVLIPSARHRVQIGPGVVRVLGDIARCHSQGRPVLTEDLADKPDAETVIRGLRSLGVLIEQKDALRRLRRGRLSLHELATLRIAQVGGCYRSGLADGEASQPQDS